MKPNCEELAANSAATIAAALRDGRLRLSGLVDSAALDAEVLLRHVLGVDRTALFVRLNGPIAQDALVRYRKLLEERLTGVPVAYLTGEKEFMGLSFAVSPAVLIPRPETEILVEWALRWLRSREIATVADVGTGSGAVALSIAAALGPNWSGRIIATDVSAEALAVAARNRSALGLEDCVELRQGSLLDPITEPIDLLLANLPYLRPNQIRENPQLAAEPRLALDGGGDGLHLIRLLLADAPRVLAPGGAIGLEIDPSQSDAVLELSHRAFPRAAVNVLPDLAGLARHVVVQTAPPSI